VGILAVRKQPASEVGAASIPVLSVSPIDEDHDELEQMLDQSIWRVNRALSVSSAVLLLQRVRVAVVVCEADLLPETWREVLAHLKLLPRPPCLIVTSRLLDDLLWAEALDLGAYDVLIKPFDPGVFRRSVISAWLHRESPAVESVRRS
jgi:DNA-binding response OmpR family regulator